MANIQLYCYDFFDIPYIIIICTMMILLNIMILLWLMGDPFCDLRLIHISVRLVLSEIMFTMHRRHVLNIVSIMKKSICTIFGSCKDSMWTTIMSNLCVYPISTLIHVYNQRFALYASLMYQCDLQLYISHAISVWSLSSHASLIYHCDLHLHISHAILVWSLPLYAPWCISLIIASTWTLLYWFDLCLYMQLAKINLSFSCVWAMIFTCI